MCKSSQGSTKQGDSQAHLIMDPAYLWFCSSTRESRCKVLPVTDPSDLTTWKASARILTETPQVCFTELFKKVIRDYISIKMKGFFPRNLFWNLKRPRKADTASLTTMLWVESLIRWTTTLLMLFCGVFAWLKYAWNNRVIGSAAFDSVEDMLWVNPDGQRSTTRLLVQSLPPPVAWEKRKGRINARKLGGQDKNKKNSNWFISEV